MVPFYVGIFDSISIENICDSNYYHMTVRELTMKNIFKKTNILYYNLCM